MRATTAKNKIHDKNESTHLPGKLQVRVFDRQLVTILISLSPYALRVTVI
jgi:hypothetical protein